MHLVELICQSYVKLFSLLKSLLWLHDIKLNLNEAEYLMKKIMEIEEGVIRLGR